MDMRQAGFTLVEIAIVTMIVGILLVPLLVLYQASTSNKHVQLTERNIRAISEGLTDFAGNNNRYPCPASLILNPGDMHYGEPDCRDGTGWSGFTEPALAGDCHAGICRAAGRDGASILIGAVPYMVMNEGGYPTANLPASQKNVEYLPGLATIDGWGNKISYVVTERLTSSSTFNVYDGAIFVNDEYGLSLLDKPGTVHFALISYGDNGRGAYTKTGSLVDSCAAGMVESNNCSQQGTLINGLRSLKEGNEYYDDIVRYVSYTASTIWANIDGYSIHNAPGGRVAVGKKEATEMLDVAGNLQATKMHTKMFCGQGGIEAGECYDPALIAGDEPDMQCPAGQVMTGIANGKGICTIPVIGGGTSSCPAGEVVVGISNRGNVKCCPINASGVLQCPLVN